MTATALHRPLYLWELTDTAKSPQDGNRAIFNMLLMFALACLGLAVTLQVGIHLATSTGAVTLPSAFSIALTTAGLTAVALFTTLVHMGLMRVAPAAKQKAFNYADGVFMSGVAILLVTGLAVYYKSIGPVSFEVLSSAVLAYIVTCYAYALAHCHQKQQALLSAARATGNRSALFLETKE